MVPKLYAAEVSPAVRATLFVVKALGIEVEVVPVNLAAGEQMTPEYLQMNPMHTVPTLKDGDFALWDSHAINIYLVEKYHADNDLYPKDLEKRSTIHQRLFLDASILFARLQAIVTGILREGVKTVKKEQSDKLTDGYNFLESLLERSKYAAGDHVTIADFSLVSTIVACNVLVPIASNRFPQISDWISRMEQLPYYKEAMQPGHDQFVGLIKSKLA